MGKGFIVKILYAFMGNVEAGLELIMGKLKDVFYVFLKCFLGPPWDILGSKPLEGAEL